jgi:hypothetical protein
MIQSFLRRPRTAGDFAADAVRALGLVSVVAAAIWWQPMDAGILALALPALLVPRFLGIRPWFDIVFCVVVLVAAWSNVLGLYESVAGWDLVVHFACTGVIAAVAYLALARAGIVPSPSSERFAPKHSFVLVPIVGLAASAAWEMLEWVGYTFISDEIFVAYVDTIGDMAFGVLGSIVAAILVAYVRLERASG